MTMCLLIVSLNVLHKLILYISFWWSTAGMLKIERKKSKNSIFPFILDFGRHVDVPNTKYQSFLQFQLLFSFKKIPTSSLNTDLNGQTAVYARFWTGTVTHRTKALYQNQSPRINWWSYHPTNFDRIIFFSSHERTKAYCRDTIWIWIKHAMIAKSAQMSKLHN